MSTEKVNNTSWAAPLMISAAFLTGLLIITAGVIKVTEIRSVSVVREQCLIQTANVAKTVQDASQATDVSAGLIRACITSELQHDYDDLDSVLETLEKQMQELKAIRDNIQAK